MKTSNSRLGPVTFFAIVLVCAMCGSNQTTQGPVGTGGSASAGGVAGTGGDVTATSGGAVGTGGFVGTGGVVGNGGSAPTGGRAKGGAIGAGGFGKGGVVGSGGSRTGGAFGTGGAMEIDGGSSSTSPCDSPSLTWKTGSKTNYTSYPDPGSDECTLYSGCEYEGLFSACEQKRSVEWVKAHNIVSVFPDFRDLKLHDLCLKSGTKTIVVTVLDECADSDCSGCCTENKGNADQLIDIESFTDARWGVEDGRIQWADLGPTKGSGCQ